MAQNSKVNTGAAAGDKLADVPASDAQAAPPDVPAQTTPLPAAVQGLAPAQPTVAVAPATPGTPAAPAGTPAAPAPPSSSPSKPRRTSSRRSNTATSATLAADDSDAELVRIHSELADLQTAVKKMTKAGDDERKNAKNIRSKLVQDVAALQGRIDSAPKVADVEPRLHTVEGQLETLAPLRDRVAELSDNLSYWRNDYTNFLSDTPQDREADSLTHRLSGLWSETEDLRKSLADMREELDQCFHELETTRVRERISERVRVLERAMIAAGTLNADGTIPYNDGYPRPRSRPSEPSRDHLPAHRGRERQVDSDDDDARDGRPVKRARRETPSYDASRRDSQRRRSRSPVTRRRSRSPVARRRTRSPSVSDDNPRPRKLARGRATTPHDSYDAALPYPPSPYVPGDGDGYQPPSMSPSPRHRVPQSPSPPPRTRRRSPSPVPGPSSRPEVHPPPSEHGDATDREVIYFGDDNCKAVRFGCNPEDKLIPKPHRRIPWGRNDPLVKGNEARREFLTSRSVVQNIFGKVDKSNGIPLPCRIGHPAAVHPNYRILQWETREQMLQFLSAWQDRPRFLTHYLAVPADNLPEADAEEEEVDDDGIDLFGLGSAREDNTRRDRSRGGRNGAGPSRGGSRGGGGSQWKGKGREDF